jgi:hypothetical protein
MKAHAQADNLRNIIDAQILERRCRSYTVLNMDASWRLSTVRSDHWRR